MQYLTLLLVTGSAVGYVSAVNVGPLTIMMNGQPLTKYVLSDYGSIKCCIQANRTSITVSGGGHVYLGDSNTSTFSTNSFYQMNLFGKRLTFDVDMSDVGCNCNGALYLVSMPAYNSQQHPQPGDNGKINITVMLTKSVAPTVQIWMY